jgi:prepilin-type N-terminal cleavage/methylation domain-containing protein
MNGRRAFGFTLIELLIAVAVVAIVAAIGIPSYQQFIERQNTRRAAVSVYSDLQMARSEALKTKQDVFVVFNPGTAGVWCYGVGQSSCDCSTGLNCDKTVNSEGFPEITLQNGSSSFTGNKTSFDGLLGVASSSGSVRLVSPSGWEQRISVAKVGRIRIAQLEK